MNQSTDINQDQYSLWVRVLHWLMAFGFFFMWGCGYYMTAIVEEDTPLEEFLFGLHISVGVTLLFLLVARIIVRILTPTPPPEPNLSRASKSVRVSDLALYIFPFLIILIGWSETNFGGHGVAWFGIEMPKVFPTMETFADIHLESMTATLHKWFAYSMLALVGVHIAAVVKHRVMDTRCFVSYDLWKKGVDCYKTRAFQAPCRRCGRVPSLPPSHP